MKKVSKYMSKVENDYGKEIARKFLDAVKKWDGSHDVYGAFYEEEVLDKLLEQVLEDTLHEHGDVDEKIINLTPHPIKILDAQSNVTTVIEPSGQVVRLPAQIESYGKIAGVPITKTKYGLSQLPPKKRGVYYIVSQMVKNAAPDRGDLLVPAQVVRGSDGRIFGCQSLGL